MPINVAEGEMLIGRSRNNTGPAYRPLFLQFLCGLDAHEASCTCWPFVLHDAHSCRRSSRKRTRPTPFRFPRALSAAVVLLRDTELSKEHCKLWRDIRGDIWIQVRRLRDSLASASYRRDLLDHFAGCDCKT